jgi:hypothetical protein
MVLAGRPRFEGSMQFTETELTDVWVIHPTPGVDSRGSFARVFCEMEMADHGLATPTAEIYRLSLARMNAGRDGAAASAQVPGTGHPASLGAGL